MKAKGFLTYVPDVILACSVILLVGTLAYSSYRLLAKTDARTEQAGKPEAQNAVTGPDFERNKALEEAQRTGQSASYEYVTDTLPLPLVGSM